MVVLSSPAASNRKDCILVFTIINRRDAWSWLYLLARLGLGLLFIYAGAVKLLDPKSFGVILARYDLAPEALLWPAAQGLPLLEVLAGLGLLWEVRGSLGAVSGMLALFAGVLWFGVLGGLEIDCGCLSPKELAQHDGLRQALYRDLMLLAVAAYLYLWRMRMRPPWAPRGWRLHWNPPNPREELNG